MYGYVFAESGTGQIVRAVVAALAAEGIPFAVVPYTRTLSRQQRDFRDRGTAAPSFDTNLICVNADQVPEFFESMRAELLPGTRNIGLWAWEVDDLPAAMAASERHLHEVWGISRFTAAALARCLTKPVRAGGRTVPRHPGRHRYSRRSRLRHEAASTARICDIGLPDLDGCSRGRIRRVLSTPDCDFAPSGTAD